MSEHAIEHQTAHGCIARMPWQCVPGQLKTRETRAKAVQSSGDQGAIAVSKRKIMMFEGHKGSGGLYLPGKKHYHR